MDFAKIIDTAQKAPDGTYKPFDPFAAATAEPALVSEVKTPEQLPGSVKLNMVFRSQRFFIGRELEAIDGQMKIFRDRDETAELEAVMNKVFAGEAMIVNRKETFLQDGSVVIWLEWGEKPEKMIREARAHLTEAELRSPERVTDRARAADAEDGDETAPARDGEGTSHEDEPDWT